MLITLCVVLGITIVLCIYLLRYVGDGKKCVCVVVLGDIGRSPRMQYHSLSLTQNGFDVDIVGYGDSIPHSDIVENERINLHHLPPHPALLSKLPRLAVYVAKVIWQVATLLVVMVTTKKPSHILLQNPPALPSLFVCWLVSRLRGCQFIVDWHNYGYTILALAHRAGHPLVKISKWYERFFGRFSDANMCVTNAMREDLKNGWGIKAVTMYDRPPLIFQSINVTQQHALLMKLAKQYDVFKPKPVAADGGERTVFTFKPSSGPAKLLAERPVLLLSSTSWTEDEDFSILLNALETYEAQVSSGSSLPELICVITGKGAQKSHYQALLREKSWSHVRVCMPWLEAEDYPTMLGCADLGVCLHMSSSGLDLPMKVVDMFGCGLPVCAIHFNCLDELVKHEENGLVFHSKEELAEQLQDLLQGFPDDCSKLNTFRKNLESFQKTRWNEAWNENVKPLFL